MKSGIVLIGPGRVGAAISKRLHEADHPVVAVIGRNQQRASDAVDFIGCDPSLATTDLTLARRGKIVLLAIPDDQISGMAQRLQETIGLSRETTLVHFSGLQPANIMKVAGSDCATISIHPLLPFADRDMATASLTDCPCAIEGDSIALPLAQELVGAMGGKAFHLDTDAKALYHTAACIASNYLVTITASARDLLVRCGLDQQQAMELLTPIQRATSDNLIRLGPEAALTGPIARGDVGTVNKHLLALKEKAPDFCGLYRSLGEQTIALATASERLSKEQISKLQKILTDEDGADSDC